MRTLLGLSRRAIAAALLLTVAACSTDATGPDAGETSGTPSTPATPTTPGSPSIPGGTTSTTPSSVLGTWSYRALSANDYYSAANGSYVGNGYGTSVLFTFTADGKYEMAMYIEATTYNCHTKIYVYDAGAVKFTATELRVYPTTGRVRASDTCNAANNFDRADDIGRKQGTCTAGRSSATRATARRTS